MTESIPPQSKADTAANRSKNVPRPPLRVVVESLPPTPPPTDEQKAEKKRQRGLEWGKVVLEVLALLGLWAYVCETRRTNNLTQQALDIQRPWVGMVGDVTFEEPKELDKNWPHFIMSYRLKNFGTAPAMNVVTPFGPIIGDANNYALVKTKVEASCKSGENIVSLTGDLLLPASDKPDTTQVGNKNAPQKFVMPGCIVYRDSKRKIHHTELCYWIDLADTSRPKTFSTCWFQGAD
jgi:hypothetical protein